MNVLDEYLIRLGTTVDQPGMRNFQNALRDATQLVDKTAMGMAKAFGKAEYEILGAFAAIGAAAVGLADKTAMADQEFRLFALRMYMSKDAARGLKVAMDALGQPLEMLAWDAELRARTHQLIADQRAMSVGGDFDAQMKKIRDIRFEFTRMEVELKYLGMHVVTQFMESLGLGPDTLLKKLHEFNNWVTHNMPAIAAKLKPIWEDLKQVFTAVGDALKAVGVAFINLVGLLTGDDTLQTAAMDFDKFAQAVAKTVHVFAVLSEAIAGTISLVAHLVSALVLVAKGDFSGAGAEVRAAVAGINAKVVGGVIGGVAGSFVGMPVIGAGIGANIGDVVSGSSTPSASMSSASIAAPQSLLDSIGWTESRNRQVNAMGQTITGPATRYGRAIGQFQLLPSTAAALGVDPYTASGNRAGAEKLLSQLLTRYHGNVAEAAGAYNWNPRGMDRFLAGKATMPGETQHYIASVLSRMGQSGAVQVGSITINVPHTNATPSDVRRSVEAGLRDAAGKRTQRALGMAQSQSWSYSGGSY